MRETLVRYVCPNVECAGSVLWTPVRIGASCRERGRLRLDAAFRSSFGALVEVRISSAKSHRIRPERSVSLLRQPITTDQCSHVTGQRVKSAHDKCDSLDPKLSNCVPCGTLKSRDLSHSVIQNYTEMETPHRTECEMMTR